MNILKKLVISLAFGSLFGCVQVSESGYYWGDYSHSYYSYLQSPSPESQAEHKETLIDIIDTSATNNLKIPSGIYAELGLIEYHANNQKQAKIYFDKEIELYPESTVLIRSIFAKATK